MKSFVTALVAALAISLGAAYVLGTFQSTADRVYTGNGAELREPGHNLVGRDFARPSGS